MGATPEPRRRTARRAKGDGTLYYDRSRRRWVGETEVGGVRRRVSATTKAQAAERLRELHAIEAAGGGIDRSVTVGDLLDDWLTHAAPNRTSEPATLDGYRWAVGRWTAELGRRKAAELRPTHVEAALRRMATADPAKPLHFHTLAKLRSVLNLAMKRAVAHRVLPYNPVAGAELPTKAPRTQPRRHLTLAQVDRFYAAAAGHDLEGLFLLMLTGGLRPGEAVAVCADALDLEEGVVEVKRARKLSRGAAHLGDTLKTDKSHRVVDLPPWTVEVLRRHIADHELTGDELLYPDTLGGVLTPGAVADELAVVLAAADLPDIAPMELRHTHATLLYEAGVPLAKIQDRLGHADLRMLLATYRHRPDVVDGASALPAPTQPGGRRLRAV